MCVVASSTRPWSGEQCAAVVAAIIVVAIVMAVAKKASTQGSITLPHRLLHMINIVLVLLAIQAGCCGCWCLRQFLVLLVSWLCSYCYCSPCYNICICCALLLASRRIQKPAAFALISSRPLSCCLLLIVAVAIVRLLPILLLLDACKCLSNHYQ